MRNEEGGRRNGELFARRGCFDGSDGAGQALVGFVHQVVKWVVFHNSCLDAQFHPVQACVTLFFDNTHLGNEIGRRLCPAGRPLIGTDRCAAPNKLPGDDICGSAARNYLPPRPPPDLRRQPACIVLCTAESRMSNPIRHWRPLFGNALKRQGIDAVLCSHHRSTRVYTTRR